MELGLARVHHLGPLEFQVHFNKFVALFIFSSLFVGNSWPFRCRKQVLVFERLFLSDGSATFSLKKKIFT
jgi:hypothetical protein